MQIILKNSNSKWQSMNPTKWQSMNPNTALKRMLLTSHRLAWR